MEMMTIIKGDEFALPHDEADAFSYDDDNNNNARDEADCV
jgi:hypothetical protein